jgi:CheY-like chemotaxis protein
MTALAPLRLLIVDDEPMLRSVIQEFLSMLGYDNFAVAGDGREALQIIRHQPLDCVISDIRMPEMALEELLTIIRRDFPHLTVIATSGYSDFSSAANILHKGADDFLGKPLNLDHLEMALMWIEERRNILAAAAAAFSPGLEFGDEATLQRQLRPMIDLLRGPRPVFAAAMLHSARVTELSLALAEDWPLPERLSLAAAGVLHEMGLSCQIFQLCQQPRRLEEPEYHLVRHTVDAHAHLTAQHIGRPEIEPIIAHHLDWLGLRPAPGGNTFTQRAATWMGIANTIDGFLQERPDRPGSTLPDLYNWLNRRQQAHPMALLKIWLEHWPKVEAFYAHELRP